MLIIFYQIILLLSYVFIIYAGLKHEDFTPIASVKAFFLALMLLAYGLTKSINQGNTLVSSLLVSVDIGRTTVFLSVGSSVCFGIVTVWLIRLFRRRKL